MRAVMAHATPAPQARSRVPAGPPGTRSSQLDACDERHSRTNLAPIVSVPALRQGPGQRSDYRADRRGYARAFTEGGAPGSAQFSPPTIPAG